MWAVDVPKGVGAVLGDSISSNEDIAKALEDYFFPFPEASIHYVFGGDVFRLGAGLRTFTFIVESVAWPNAFAELQIGPVIVEAQVGGGVFAVYGIANSIETGKVFFPDLSAWFQLGKSVRLGGGVLGVFLPEVETTTLPFVLYFGGKAAIKI